VITQDLVCPADCVPRHTNAEGLTKQRRALIGVWVLIVTGLAVRAWQAPTVAGTYDGTVDALMLLGQRLLRGELLFEHSFVDQWPIAQALYAPAAWFASLRAHRLVLLLIDLLAGLLLAHSLPRLSMAGLIPLRHDSLLPAGIVMLFVTISQKLPGGLSGPLQPFANAFLVIALSVLLRGGPRRLNAVLAGFAVFGAMATASTLMSPLLLTGALLVVLRPCLRPLIPPLLGGVLLGAMGTALPYTLEPGGPARLWAGGVVLPLEWESMKVSSGQELTTLFVRMLDADVAGLTVWLLALVPAIGLLQLARREWRGGVEGAERPLLVPGLALIFLLELASALQRSSYRDDDLQLMALPLVLLLCSGMAALERSSPGPAPRLAAAATLIVSLIFLNNVFVAELTARPRRLPEHVRELEQDRAAVRTYLSAQPATDRRFTAPQDVALQWQLAAEPTTVGIGPEWSLNQNGLRASAATRTLGLPVTVEEACAQVMDPRNHYVVWQRTDPEGPNTEAFLRGCLAGEPAGWDDVGATLGLDSGEYWLLRRRSPDS
jgi:hypothetical protein